MSCIYTIQVTLSDCNDTSAGLSENIKKKIPAAAAAAIYVLELEHCCIKIINENKGRITILCQIEKYFLWQQCPICISRWIALLEKWKAFPPWWDQWAEK